MANSVTFIILLVLLNAFKATGQNAIDRAAKLITIADSVILISHVATEENHDKPVGVVLPPGVVDEIKPIVFPSFFSGKKINEAIIMQRRLLAKQEVIELVKIIQKPVRKSNIGYIPLCFEPHHAVLIYDKGRLSFIDICFHCSGMVTSADLRLNNMDFENGKWEEMKAFFLKNGLTYELDDND